MIDVFEGAFDVRLDYREFGCLDQIKAKDRETLPTVLPPDEVARVIKAVPLFRYRVPLLLIYASGLRVHECMNHEPHG